MNTIAGKTAPQVKRIRDYRGAWLAFSLIALIVAATFANLQGEGMGFMIGSAGAYLLFPAIVPGLLALGLRLFNKRLPAQTWLVVYGLAFALFLLSSGISMWAKTTLAP